MDLAGGAAAEEELTVRSLGGKVEGFFDRKVRFFRYGEGSVQIPPGKVTHIVLTLFGRMPTDQLRGQANIGGGQQEAQVSLSVKLVSDRTGKVLRAKVFDAQAPISGTDANAVVNGINSAFDSIARDLVKWVLAAV